MNRLAIVAACALTAASAAVAQQRLLGIDTVGNALWEINPATGAAVNLGAIIGATGTLGGLSYDPATDTLYASSTGNDNLWRINYNTRVATLIGDYNVGTAVVMHGLELNTNTGRMYGTSFAIASNANFFEINPATGAATPIATLAQAPGFGSLGFVPSSGTMYHISTDTDSLYTINVGTGATTLVGPLGLASQIGVGMAYSASTGMLAINNSGTDGLYSINLSTGAATLIGSMPSSNMIALAFVPAPGTAALLGLAGLAAARRRR